MAHQVERLVKIGKKDFALLDELFPSKKKSSGPRGPISKYQASDRFPHQNSNHHHLQPYVSRLTPVITVRERVINSSQAVQFYDGMEVEEVVDHRMGNHPRG